MGKTLKDLQENELLSEPRLENETQAQYKARRRIKNMASKLYLKNRVSNVKTSVFDYARLIIHMTNPKY